MHLLPRRSLALVLVTAACGGDDGGSGDETSSTGASMSATLGPETSGSPTTQGGSSSGTSADTTTESGSSTGGSTVGDTSGTDTGATDSGSDGTTGDGLGDCCTAHMGPGCTIPEISECVCMVDAPCCVGNWDAVCVGDVEKLRCADCTP